MFVVIAYDVNTLTKEGRRRLRKVAKLCEGVGQRVQYSVFECQLTDAQLERLRQRIDKVVIPEEDNLRVYHIHGSREDCVEIFGRDGYVDYEDVLLV
ncbi:MAG: CRISPR-associated endonuclease Cas2 [Capsulimonadaceae bacterium]|nr:CRISPR-associated endonuclease Cas2 [Capsulimonadaceae bacterium]